MGDVTPSDASDEMYVTKRDGNQEIVSFDKILKRIKNLGQEANLKPTMNVNLQSGFNSSGSMTDKDMNPSPAGADSNHHRFKINYTALVMKVIDQLYDGISTTKIDELSAEQCASMASIHTDYNALAGRISISNHHKNTTPSFVNAMTELYSFLDKQGNHSPLVSQELYEIVCKYPSELEDMVVHDRDYLIDYFGFKTLDRAYLTRINKKTVERPQYMWLRVAIGIHGDNLEKIKETYEYMSQKCFTHATPTLFNAGTPRPQLSSCFLLSMEEDSIDGIFNTLKDCALISKLAGGIGLHIHNVRAKGSHIRGTNGSSNGIVPMLRVFNNTAKYVDQGGGKRNGSFAIYLEPWHADIESFLQMRKNHGDEELKARDLFYALWIPDLFMERIKADANWTLMCPNECPGLADVHGQDFVELYTKYEAEGRGRATVKARQLWFQVLDAQMETGTPYLLYKDACNKKSNQKNIGTIKSSNLCVAPETQILTDKGHLEIQQLAGQKVNVWNGEEFSEVEVFQTGENQELMEVKTDDGCTLTCTPYHKFFIQNSYSKKSCQLVEAKDLKMGDKLQKCVYPVIDGNEKMKHAYTHGFFCGDGTYTNNHSEHKQCEWRSLEGHYFCKRHLDFETEFTIEDIKNNPNTRIDKCNAMSYVKKPLAYLYGEKKDLLKHMEYRTMTENDTRITLQLPLDLDEKFYVPKNANLQDKLTWFAGYCDADGSIAVNGTNKQLQVSSINPEFLFDVKMMLQTCGVNPKLRKMRDAATSNLPDGKGGRRDFATQPVYRLLITSCDLIALKDLGFSPKRLKMENIVAPNRNATQFVKIASATLLDRRDNTFCFTEPKRHAGIFNGMLTSQCTEVIQVSNEEESAVCNLASIALPAFISSTDNSFDFEKLHKVSRIVTYNLNRVIDINYYPTEKTKRSNLRHRPIGIGVQGLADVFMILGFPFASDEARQLNKRIFETIYHAALEESCDLAKRDGAYETFPGSPASQGILQYDMWNVEPEPGRYDWTSLKTEIQTHGLRNSLLLAPMPTASTSQILGYNECIEPITSNIYNRRTLAGEFILANKYLMQDLVKLDLWNEKIKNNIIANHGSVQHIESIPKDIREKYKTVWEIPMRALIDMAADRGAYVCQSQSLNLWLEDPTYSNLTSMHFYSWSKGLKTGIYYLRRRARHQAQQFTIEPEKKKGESASEEVCEMCSA
jgi:ribonucleoside-diphosphate reductase alpha chain